MWRLLLALLVVTATPWRAAAHDDDLPPSATIDRQPVHVGAPVRAAHLTELRGTVHDDLTGIAAVEVLFCPNGQLDDGWSCGDTPLPGTIERRHADVVCTSTDRRNCTWTVAVPVAPGRYLAFVQVTDQAGRVGRAGPADLLVV